MTDCYVVSVHHTMREDRYITIWRIDDTACILTVRQLLSKRAYSVADAMLAARGEEKC